MLPYGTIKLHSSGPDSSNLQDVHRRREDRYGLNQARSSSCTPTAVSLLISVVS